METGRLKLALSAGALALSMALAGCGGGGSSGTPENHNGGDGVKTLAERQAEDRVKITAALTKARDAVVVVNENAVDATDKQITDADDYIKAARTTVRESEIPQEEKDGRLGELATLKLGLDAAVMRRTEAKNTATTAANKAKTDKAKALRTALMEGGGTGSNGNIGENAEEAALRNDFRSIRFGADNTAEITLKEKMGASVEPLGDWKGTHYEGDNDETGEDKVTAMLGAYSNQGEPTMMDFPATGDPGGTITRLGARNDQRAYEITEVAAGDPLIDGDNFPSSTTQTYTTNAERTFSGTYAGASGTYSCSGSEGECTATVGDNGIALSSAGTWTFTPGAGQKYAEPDGEYLEFGWWKREDNDGEATHATAYIRPVGLGNPVPLTTTHTGGTAIYDGKAAGLFAISDPIRSQDDDSGHFTANAVLTATFTGEDSKLKGEITGFRLNGSSTDPGWSVTLNERTASSGTFTGPSTTEWSIGDNQKFAKAGGWSVSMYNNPDDERDGNAAPDLVAGTFHSVGSNTHQMRGAFGAERPQN